MKNRLFSRYGIFTALFAIILTLIIAGTVLLCSYKAKNTSDVPFSLSLKEGNISIYPFERDGEYYLFIPDGFSLSDFDLRKNNLQIENDFTKYDGEDKLIIKADREYLVHIIEIDRVPALFINITAGDIDEVNQDKDKKTVARAQFSIYDENAVCVLNQSGKVKGRGNTSWLYYDKKPYSITLNKSESILGMNPSEKWCLISNSAEKYAVANDLVYSFAEKLDLNYVPDRRYVNVYINGKYNGLYLLAERIVSEENRWQADNRDSYLLETDMNMNPAKMDTYFITKGNNIIEVKHPNWGGASRIETIKNEVQQLEDSLLDFENDEWKEKIDMDSWARIYLLDEFFENVDGGFHSVFFYKDKNGLFVRGPVWDYDRSFADDPNVILTGNEYRSANQISVAYNYCLLQRKEFKQRVLQIFEGEFVPLIDSFLSSEIQNKEQMIHSSVIADQIRWKTSIDEDFHSDELFDYLMDRSAFLIEYYSNIDRYCKVQIEETGMAYYLRNYIVPKGGRVSDITNLNKDLITGDLYYKDTGFLFDADDVVDRDICLVRKLDYEETIPNLHPETEENSVGFLYMTTIFVFLIGFVALLVVVFKRFVDGKI